MTAEKAPRITVEIAAGELIDKLTILAIKAERLSDPAALANVARERAALETARTDALSPNPTLDRLTAELKAVNEALWQIEDDIRACERAGDFGPRFIALARAVYHTNDERARLKRAIDTHTGSRLTEEKSYAPY